MTAAGGQPTPNLSKVAYAERGKPVFPPGELGQADREESPRKCGYGKSEEAKAAL